MYKTDLKYDEATRKFILNGKVLKLTNKEHLILLHLYKEAEYVSTHEEIMERVWGPKFKEDHHYLRVYIRSLRQKLEYDPNYPRIIIGQHGVGYYLAKMNGD